MMPRDRLAVWVRGTVVVLVYAAALVIAPLLIMALSQWITIPAVGWFHYVPGEQAPPFAQQFHHWFLDTYNIIRLALDDRARAALVVIAILAVSWLALLWISLSTVWCLALDGADAVRDRAAHWGPRGWIASLLATVVLSSTASPAHATTGTRPVATAPQHPHDTRSGGYSHAWATDSPATPGDHTQPPPRRPGVSLPADIRPDCPRVRVRRGDTLSRIAERELGTIARWHDLARVNRFQLGPNPDHLEPGWEILLPPEAAPPKQRPTKVVTVARGDTLWSLSERELGTPNRWGELWDLNLRRTQPDGLQLSLPDRLQPGWQSVVPDEPHNKPAPGFTPTAPVPSQDPFTIDPWPDPFPPPTATPSDPSHAGTAPAPDPAADTRPPATSPPSRRASAPHGHARPRAAARPSEGVEPATGVFLGLGLAAALSIALRRARLRHHAKYTPGHPYQDYQPAPTVQALHLAHLTATRDPDTHEPHATDHTHPNQADQIAARPTPRSTPPAHAPAHTPLPIELGVHHEQTVRLDLAGCQGLGISGPVDTDAVRALLLHLLSRHTPREEPPLPLVMTRADADQLLNDPDDPPSTVTLVDDLPDALHLLKQASTTTSAIDDRSTQDTDAPATHTVLVTRTPVEYAYQLYTLLRDRRGIAAVILGPWPDGVSLTVNRDGVITHVSPESNRALCGTRLFTATSQAGSEVEPLTPTPRTPLPPSAAPVNLARLTYGHDPRETDTSDDDTAPSETEPTTATLSSAEQSEPNPATASSASENLTVEGPGLDTSHATSGTTGTERGSPATAEPHHAGQTRDAEAPPVRLHVFGPFRLVWTDPAGDEHELACTRRQRLLLTYLALHPQGVARETLLDHLFSEASQPTNTANTQLSRLRHHLLQATRGQVSGIIDTSHHRFRLDPTLVRSDYAEFDQAATRLRHATTAEQRHEALHTLLRCHTGPLGADLDDYEWLTIPRHEAERLYINAIGELARSNIDTDPDHTLHLLESAVRDDPHNESIYRDIMRLQHKLDLTDAISRTYTLLTTRLAELDLTPEPRTTALVEQLLNHTSHTTT